LIAGNISEHHQMSFRESVWGSLKTGFLYQFLHILCWKFPAQALKVLLSVPLLLQCGVSQISSRSLLMLWTKLVDII